MSNNKEIICKLIKAKNQEANSYTDQTCYNAAYCYGYVDGATMALNTLSGVPERHKCYAILSHYSNEDIGTFDSVAICGGVHMSFESAKKAADEMLAVDKENGCHDDAVPFHSTTARLESLSRQLSRLLPATSLICKVSVRQTAGNPFWINAVTWSSCLLCPLTLTGFPTAP